MQQALLKIVSATTSQSWGGKNGGRERGDRVTINFYEKGEKRKGGGGDKPGGGGATIP